MPTVNGLITADDVGHLQPITLIGIRREWHSPPRAFAVYVEIVNPAEESFDLIVELWRGKNLVHSSGDELFPGNARRFHWVQLWQFDDLELKSHTLVARLNGKAVDSVTLDFGSPEK